MVPTWTISCFLLYYWAYRVEPLDYSLNQYNTSGFNQFSWHNGAHSNLSRQSSSMSLSNHESDGSHVTSSIASIPSNFAQRYLVGNLTGQFIFQVAPPSIKVTYLGLNGHSLYIMGVGFSNKSKFRYDEKNNQLTLLSLDTTTVGHYSAVDTNWQTYKTIVSAINVSSFVIENYRVTEERNHSSLVTCSISIIRSTFTEADFSTSSISSSTKSTGTENMPRLNLFLSTRISSSLSPLSDDKITNDTFVGQTLIRSIAMRQSLTRADHNGTIQCQVESTNTLDVYLTRTEFVDIYYGPDLETGALHKVMLESEMMKIIAMECQIEANPNPSYVWYEVFVNGTVDSPSSYDQYMIPSPGPVQSVFGTTREIQRIYQNPGQYAMQCQAQANGRTVRQDFFITVHRQSHLLKIASDMNTNEQKSSRVPIILGITVGIILIVLLSMILVAAIIYLKRRKTNPDAKISLPDQPSSDKPVKSRWGNLPIDYSKYKADSSSTSHLVESVENTSIQGPTVGPRSSPINSRHSSYRQTPTNVVSLSYRQASALPGFRPLTSNNSYSAEHDEMDEASTSIVIRPSIINRSRTTTPLGSHKSLSTSIQSLRSNQQPTVSLPMKKRSHDLSTLNRQEKRNVSPQPKSPQHEYQHHHYQNPIQLQSQQKPATDNTSSEEDDEQRSVDQQIKPLASNYIDPSNLVSVNQISRYTPVDSHPLKENHYASSYVPDQLAIPSQIKEKFHDEIPPPYQQVATHSPNLNAYMYREPTEV